MATGGIQIRLLGRFAVSIDGEEVPPGAFGGRLVRALLRNLLIRRGVFVSKDALTEALWPERSPADPAANLDVLVSRARRALRDPTLIVAGSGGYCFVRDGRCLVDAELFLSHVESGQAAAGNRSSGSGQPAFRAFQAALDLWSGEALPEDAYADWAQEYRRELSRAHLDALEGAADSALAAGMAARAVVFAERAVAREPLREASHLLLARALASVGDQAGALAAIDRLRRRFAEDLGLDPSQEALALELQILRGEAPEWVDRSPRRTPLVTALGAAAALAFVGRGDEVQRLLAAFSPSVPAAAVVSGRSGTGKSRLLAEVRARLQIPAVAARALRPERDESWSLGRTLLREALALDVTLAMAIGERVAEALAGIVPELWELRPSLPPPGTTAIDPESRRTLALEAAVGILQQVGSPGAVVVVDDLQWADPTSLSLLSLLVHRAPALGLLLAYRPEEVSRAGTVAAFLDDLPAMDRPLLRVPLQPLPAGAIAELVAEESIARAIVEETDLTPFAVNEVLRGLGEQGALTLDGSGRWRARTDRAAELARSAAKLGQRQAISARINWQPPHRRDVLSLLALLGREVSPSLLQIATGMAPAALLDDLDTLSRAGLARAGEEGWATGHDLVSEVLVEALEPGRRSALHAALARALKQAGSEPSELAAHLEAAADPGATEAYLDAAHKALDHYASEEAETLAQAGLRLRPEAHVRGELLRARAEARTRRGDFGGAREDLTAAIAGSHSGSERARLMARLAMLTSGSTDLRRAADLIERALVEAGDDVAARAEVLYVGAIVDMNSGAQAEASSRYAEALVLFEQTGNARGIADILDAQAMATLVEGRVADAAEALGRAAHLFLDSGELIRVIWPLGSRGAALGWMLRGEEGLRDIDEALDLAQTLRHQEAEAYCLLERALTLTTLGRLAEAIHAGRDAVVIAERIGHAEWTAGSLLALGAAHQEAGDLADAEDALRRSLALAGPRNIAHFVSWAESELALVLIARGELPEAEALVNHALSIDTPLTHYQARLARAELALARGDAAAGTLAAEALALAEAGGHLHTASKLRELIGRTASLD